MKSLYHLNSLIYWELFQRWANGQVTGVDVDMAYCRGIVLVNVPWFLSSTSILFAVLHEL
jgi:hypothetical protein